MNTKRKKVANLLWIVGVLVIFQTAAGPVVSARPTALAAAPTVRQIASSPALPGVLLASFVGTNEVRYSRSRGINWEPVGNTAWSADGIDPVRVAVTPRSSTEPLTRFLVAPTIVLPTYTWDGPDTIYRSGDWGRTWLSMNQIDASDYLVSETIDALQLISSISDPQVIYFVSFWTEADMFIGSVDVAQAYASLDAGVTWANMDTPLLGYPTWVIPSPRTPRKVYVSFYNIDTWWKISEDAGQTWSGEMESPDGKFVFDPSSEDILYTPNSYSLNAGQNWQSYPINPCKTWDGAILTDPKVSGTLFLTCDDKVWRSQDTGAHWTDLFLPGVQTLDADWGTPGRILAARGDGLWGSDDHGSTWFLLTPDFGSLPEHQFLPAVIH